MENRQWRRNAVRIKQLDSLVRRINKIEKDK
jgi:UDP-3-O-[3-hydroxymyristoyl] glucosamine N-acyltransferase